jgi:hypothetical protein
MASKKVGSFGKKGITDMSPPLRKYNAVGKLSTTRAGSPFPPEEEGKHYRGSCQNMSAYFS